VAPGDIGEARPESVTPGAEIQDDIWPSAHLRANLLTSEYDFGTAPL